MKATINPGAEFDWTGKTWEELAVAYGMDEKSMREEAIEFQNCEGFDDEGNESDDLHEWLTNENAAFVDNTPF